MRLPRPTPPANQRHVQQSDLPPEQIHTLDPVPRGRLAGCVASVLLGAWMLAVPVALIDSLKEAPGAGLVTAIVIACAASTAGLGGFLFFNARDHRRPWPIALITALAAAVAAALGSASQPVYGLLLAVPAVVAGVPALIALARDAGRSRHRAPGS